MNVSDMQKPTINDMPEYLFFFKLINNSHSNKFLKKHIKCFLDIIWLSLIIKNLICIAKYYVLYCLSCVVLNPNVTLKTITSGGCSHCF